MDTLTPAGRAWATAHAEHSIVANVALQAAEKDCTWPIKFREASILVANEEGATLAPADVPAPVRFPNIEIELLGTDSNALAILSRVQRALKDGLRKDGVDPGEIKKLCDEFMDEATAGDYDHLLQTCMKWVEVA